MNTTALTTIRIEPLIEQIEHLRKQMQQAEEDHQAVLDLVQPHYQESARNMLHYLSLRSHEMRDLQEQLSALAISSFGHSEGYTMGNLDNILLLLQLLRGDQIEQPATRVNDNRGYEWAKERLNRHLVDLFGPCDRGHCSKIMVTLPTEASYNYEMVKELIKAGMDVARINTSHDTPDEWRKMILYIRRASEETGRHCTVYMDLSGPKLRTGEVKENEEKQKKNEEPNFQLFMGDTLEVYREPIAGEGALLNEQGGLLRPARISTTLPEVFDDVRPGEQFCIDDGKIRGIVRQVAPDKFSVVITQASIKGSRVRADKGINFPDTHLSLPSLTADDYANLPFIAEYADVVGYSFVRRPDDVRILQRELEKLGRPEMGIVLKVETKEAFDRLPNLLLAAMQSSKVGVMIARGDLAVEIGFDRIAEVQEEILWICEAAHIPNIWATEVLDKLAKKGAATRAEITDAAMSGRAECVMLNKGPHIVAAVQMLDNIIGRMADHQFKRKVNLRPLGVAKRFLKER
ncbi:MAG: pyruvate kinase [Saprospiraceae bacterium]|nr:pyruvate kinase [Saprospiraceae bacterium]